MSTQIKQEMIRLMFIVFHTSEKCKSKDRSVVHRQNEKLWPVIASLSTRENDIGFH